MNETKGKLKSKWTIGIGLLVGLVAFFAVSYGLVPKGQPSLLTEEEVRRLITDHPRSRYFIVKPETVEFVSLELIPTEELVEDIDKMEKLPDKVWLVEYQCEGLVVDIYLADPPFRWLVQCVINPYTGGRISVHARPLEVFQLQPTAPSASTTQRLYYNVVLINPNDFPVTTYMPTSFTVTLTRVIYSRGIAFNTTGVWLTTLRPHEEITLYDGVIALPAQKGTYWLQAAKPPYRMPEGWPTAKIVFHTLPTLIALEVE